MNHAQAYIAITMDDGSLSIMGFVTRGRGDLPVGAQPLFDLWWTRQPTDANLADEFSRAFPLTDRKGNPLPQPVRWRLVQPSEIPADRTYRDALVDDGTKLKHDPDKVRAIKVARKLRGV